MKNWCYLCGGEVVWQSDFSYEDFGLFDEEGIVSVWSCSNCGATIEIYKGESDED